MPGESVKAVCRRHGVSPATFYQWKAKYGGLEPSDLKRLKDLERENSRLKQLYAELSLENQALKDLIHRKL
jgi:putative transposase